MFVSEQRREQARRAAAKNAGTSRKKGDGHPATADRVYTAREWEFMQAIERWKTRTGRQFPRWAEVLAVVDSLGYVQNWRETPPEVADAIRAAEQKFIEAGP